jgi:hypothetical protein
MGDAAGGTVREAAHVELVNHRVGEPAAQVAVPLPVEGVVHHHALGRPHDPVAAVDEPTGEGPGIGVDEAGPAVEALAPFRVAGPVGLEVVEAARAEPRHEQAPDVPPPVARRIEVDHLARLGIGHARVEEHPHRGGGVAVDHELHARSPRGGLPGRRRIVAPPGPRNPIMEDGAVGEGIAELEAGEGLPVVEPVGGSRGAGHGVEDTLGTRPAGPDGGAPGAPSPGLAGPAVAGMMRG